MNGTSNTSIVFIIYDRLHNKNRWSQWPRGLRRRSSAARLLRLWVRIPPRAWMFVCCECCVLSGRGLCDGLITRPEESYRLWCVVCDQETSKTRRLRPATGLWKIQTQWVVTAGKQTNKQICTSNKLLLLRARLHVSTLIIGHLQAFLLFSSQILCMLGSHHVYL